MKLPRTPIIAASVATLLILTGCTGETDAEPSVSAEPSSSPSPSPDAEAERLPALDDLVITTAGIGSLQPGGVTGDTDMIVYTPDFCIGIPGIDDYVAGTDEAARFVQNDVYPERTFGGGVADQGLPSDVPVDERTIEYVQVRGSEISTEKGIGVGSTTEELLAAYPDARIVTDSPGYSTQYVIEDAQGTIRFEVTHNDIDTISAGQIYIIRIQAPLPADYEYFQMMGNDGGPESCL